MPSAPATFPKGRSGAGKGARSCSQVYSLKVVWTSKGRESREVGVKSWDPRGGVEGGAEVSELASGIGRGRVLGDVRGWWPALEKEVGRRGRKVEVVYKAKNERAVGILLPSARTYKRGKREKGSEEMGFHSPL